MLKTTKEFIVKKMEETAKKYNVIQWDEVTIKDYKVILCAEVTEDGVLTQIKINMPTSKFADGTDTICFVDYGNIAEEIELYLMEKKLMHSSRKIGDVYSEDGVLNMDVSLVRVELLKKIVDNTDWSPMVNSFLTKVNPYLKDDFLRTAHQYYGAYVNVHGEDSFSEEEKKRILRMKKLPEDINFSSAFNIENYLDVKGFAFEHTSLQVLTDHVSLEGYFDVDLMSYYILANDKIYSERALAFFRKLLFEKGIHNNDFFYSEKVDFIRNN